MSARAWLRGNAASQGYCLSEARLRELRLAVRFPIALCLVFVAVSLALKSPAMLLVLAAVGTVAGFTPRHPFDLVWNHGVRHLLGAAELPPNPLRRRHAFKVGTALLLVVAGLFAVGMSALALVVGGLTVAACTSAAVLNFCVPSHALALLERRRRHHTRLA